jgi:hypothetical protein
MILYSTSSKQSDKEQTDFILLITLSNVNKLPDNKLLTELNKPDKIVPTAVVPNK